MQINVKFQFIDFTANFICFLFTHIIGKSPYQSTHNTDIFYQRYDMSTIIKKKGNLHVRMWMNVFQVNDAIFTWFHQTKILSYVSVSISCYHWRFERYFMLIEHKTWLPFMCASEWSALNSFSFNFFFFFVKFFFCLQRWF
jgi:hypothetical protein